MPELSSPVVRARLPKQARLICGHPAACNPELCTSSAGNTERFDSIGGSPLKQLVMTEALPTALFVATAGIISAQLSRRIVQRAQQGYKDGLSGTRRAGVRHTINSGRLPL